MSNMTKVSFGRAEKLIAFLHFFWKSHLFQSPPPAPPAAPPAATAAPPWAVPRGPAPSQEPALREPGVTGITKFYGKNDEKAGYGMR